MAKVDVTSEILKHDDDEIIAYLYEKMTLARRMYSKALDEKAPEQLYAMYGCIDDVHTVLKALNRRNEEKAV